jgi:Ribophorin I
VTTRAILPEGSSAVTVQPSPFVLEESDSKAYSYLDTFFGRPTKTMTVANVTLAAAAHPLQVRVRAMNALASWWQLRARRAPPRRARCRRRARVCLLACVSGVVNVSACATHPPQAPAGLCVPACASVVDQW